MAGIQISNKVQLSWTTSPTGTALDLTDIENFCEKARQLFGGNVQVDVGNSGLCISKYVPVKEDSNGEVRTG